jgi:hypothetical protein
MCGADEKLKLRLELTGCIRDLWNFGVHGLSGVRERPGRLIGSGKLDRKSLIIECF